MTSSCAGWARTASTATTPRTGCGHGRCHRRSAEGARGVLILLIEAAQGDLFRGGLISEGSARPCGGWAEGSAVPAPTHRVEPLTEPPDTVVAVPGSKSVTNRALVCAALADGAGRPWTGWHRLRRTTPRPCSSAVRASARRAGWTSTGPRRRCGSRPVPGGPGSNGPRSTRRLRHDDHGSSPPVATLGRATVGSTAASPLRARGRWATVFDRARRRSAPASNRSASPGATSRCRSTADGLTGGELAVRGRRREPVRVHTAARRHPPWPRGIDRADLTESSPVRTSTSRGR